MKASIVALAALTIASVGCASDKPSRELVNARTAYDRARSSDAAQYAPDTLVDAQRALQSAEKAHDDDAASDTERSRGYVAERKAELAMVTGTLARERREQQQAEHEYAQLQDKVQSETQRKLTATQGQLQETQAQLEAEQRARAAMQGVRQDERGTVITLSGGVMFASGKSELLPSARSHLDNLAAAISQSPAEQPITIEGYTDSKGSDSKNMKLSQARADSVKDYLVKKGIKAERIQTAGKGEADPVATNDTADGRANNRRVEVIIAQAPGPQPGMTPAAGKATPRPSAAPSAPAAPTTQHAMPSAAPKTTAPHAPPPSVPPRVP